MRRLASPALAALLTCAATALAAPPPHWTVGEDAVRDGLTGLEWQRDHSPSRMALDAARGWCRSLSLAGHADWRLPTAKELNSIVDVRRHAPAVDAELFALPEDAPQFWTDTPVLEWALSQVVVDLHEGALVRASTGMGAAWARCVRHR